MDETKQARPAQEPVEAPAARKRRKTRNAVPRGKRRSASGDVPPVLTPRGIEDFSVHEAVDAATESKAYAVRDILARAAHGDPRGLIDSFDAILAGASPDDVVALRKLAEIAAGPDDLPATVQDDDRPAAVGAQFLGQRAALLQPAAHEAPARILGAVGVDRTAMPGAMHAGPARLHVDDLRPQPTLAARRA